MLVLSHDALDDVARNALSRSLQAFGYGAEACTFATLYPHDKDAEGGDIALDAQALFLLIEGLDPVCVICADSNTAESVAGAYRTTCELDAATRVFGRPAVTFRDLSSMLATEDGKQHAWKLLKSLPKRS